MIKTMLKIGLIESLFPHLGLVMFITVERSGQLPFPAATQHDGELTYLRSHHPQGE